jgi:hypothetical protein
VEGERMLHLVIGIDTEGDNQWDVRARERQTFENIYALAHLHDLFARWGVRPTYVITYPVARDPRSGDVLRALLSRGDCEIGAHHHAWETPPCAPEDVRRHPYALQLPSGQFAQQLESLSEAIAKVAGARPVTYRSGRFGLGASHVSVLERAGYLVDSSVAPLFYETHKGGPDFVGAPRRPYFLSYDSAVESGNSDVLEVPISAGLNRRWPAAVERLYARAPWPYTTKRILRKLGIARMLWLRPSYSSLDDMRSLARQIADAGEPVLSLVFHSSEAIVGGSPYNRTQPQLDAFLERLEAFLTFATRDLSAVPVTFAEFRTRFLAQAAGRAA